MVEGAHVPARYDIVLMDLEPAEGREQAGHRTAPARRSESFGGRVGPVSLCPVTSRDRGYIFEGRFPDSNPILVDHVKSLDWRERSARLTNKETLRVLLDQ